MINRTYLLAAATLAVATASAAGAQTPTLQRDLTVARPTDFSTLTLRPAKPAKTALVVILENGGIVNNLDPAVREKLNVSIPFAKCGNFNFRMRDGEAIPALIARLAGEIGANVQCLNPFAWRIESVSLRDFVNERTDRMLQDTVKGANSILATQRRYDQVVVMEDANATPAQVLAKMRELAPTHVLDVHVLTHGSTNRFVGYRGVNFNDTSFFAPLRAEQAANKPMFIRAVYQMNCLSGTLKDEWEALGAQAVNGTRGSELNSMPWQYFHFMGNWINDRDGFKLSTDTAYNEAAAYTTPLYTLFGVGGAVTDSQLTLSAGSNASLRAD